MTVPFQASLFDAKLALRCCLGYAKCGLNFCMGSMYTLAHTMPCVECPVRICSAHLLTVMSAHMLPSCTVLLQLQSARLHGSVS